MPRPSPTLATTYAQRRHLHAVGSPLITAAQRIGTRSAARFSAAFPARARMLVYELADSADAVVGNESRSFHSREADNATPPNSRRASMTDTSPHGFLAADLPTSTVSKIHAKFPQWFAAAGSLSALGMRVLPRLTPNKEDNQQLTVAILYARALTSFQSAYTLAERGLVADSRTVVRSAVETAVVLNAIVHDPNNIDLLVRRHQWHNRKLLKSWLDDPQAVAAMSAEQRAAFQNAINDIDVTTPHARVKNTRDPVIVAALAVKFGLLWLYNAVYRPTSGDAAHTSIQALESHVQADAKSEIEGLRFGPDVAGVPSTLHMAIAAFIPAIQASVTLFGIQEFQPDVDACVEAWKALDESSKS